MLGAGPRNTDGITLLKGVVADQVRWHLTRDANNRNRIHQSVGETRNSIGCARAGCDKHDADLTRRAGIALGRVDRSAFLAHQDVADFFLLEQLIVDRQHRAARIAEDHFDALVGQRRDHHFRAGHCPRHCNTLQLASSQAAVTLKTGLDPSGGRMPGQRQL